MSLIQVLPHLKHPEPGPQIPNLLQEGSQALWLASQVNDQQKLLIFVVPSTQKIDDYLSYLRAMGVKHILVYPDVVQDDPSSPLARYQAQNRRHDQHQIRLKLQKPELDYCLIISFASLHQDVMDQETWEQSSIRLQQGQVVQPQLLMQQLIQLGYEVVDRVTEPGEFTRRGGLVDIFPVGHEHPYRIEWFDDEIERIHSYQLYASRQPVWQQEIVISPAYDWVIPKEISPAVFEELETEEAAVAIEQYNYEVDLGETKYALHPWVPLWQILPALSPLALTQATQHLYQRWLEKYHPSSNSFEAHFQTTLLTPHDGQTQGAILPPIDRRLDQLASTLNEWLENHYKIVVITSQPQRILTILGERHCPVSYGQNFDPTYQTVWVMRGHIPKGFAYAPGQFFCLTDVELFGRQVDKAEKTVSKEPQLALEQLKPGLLVVHETHGIGEYQSLLHSSISGQEREYLEIIYAGNDKLLVPVEQLNRLTLYHGVGKSKAKLNRMGGADWEKTKSKVKSAVADIAHDLVLTQAQRAQAKGFAYPPDTDWQQVLEMAFPYEETPDQLQAIQDTKRDMESERPMDRLICGDVGFGKTEVAIRAAFKAVMAGKQVAILAPTTILAQQHFNVCQERFANFPVRMALLSRYKTQKEAQRIFTELSLGMLDVVVATHRILSKDLKFKDLGLLIIDEEHRFGVSHKEKLKQLKANIDILTMSATPIPRTLHMALSGLRSLSSIETPPPNRFPIKTIVSPYQNQLIKSAIEAELERGGQVYFVHNRVTSIYDLAETVRQMVPQARLRVGHGQMTKHELEDVMFSFYNYECDVLLSTTIVESGLDVPNANTLIVDRVDQLGLAQIHQLRGRIGRSDVQGFAYLLYDAGKSLTSEAQERLNIIQEFTGLGAGYYIALKDLEMRGIGDLLGARQHGRIAAVGFETYCQLLNEAVAEIKGQPEQAVRPASVVIDLNLPAFIPDQWIKDQPYKIALYRTLAQVDSLQHLENLQEYCISRYGAMPRSAEILWRITRIRIMLSRLGAKRVAYDGSQLVVEVNLQLQRWEKMLKLHPVLQRWQYTESQIYTTKDAYSHELNLGLLEQLGETV